jgi:spore maturation protein SpmB
MFIVHSPTEVSRHEPKQIDYSRTLSISADKGVWLDILVSVALLSKLPHVVGTMAYLTRTSHQPISLHFSRVE